MKNTSDKGQFLLSLLYFHNNNNNITIDLLSLRSHLINSPTSSRKAPSSAFNYVLK